MDEASDHSVEDKSQDLEEGNRKEATPMINISEVCTLGVCGDVCVLPAGGGCQLGSRFQR